MNGMLLSLQLLHATISPLLSYKLAIPSLQLKFEKLIQCHPPSFGWVLII